MGFTKEQQVYLIECWGIDRFAPLKFFSLGALKRRVYSNDLLSNESTRSKKKRGISF